MCFDPSAGPPDPPRSGRLASSDRLTLRSDDGTEVAARLARTADPGAPGVVIIPDVRGLHRYYEELAGRVAGAGAHALAIDLYSRSAGPGYRDERFNPAPHRASLRDDDLRADVRAAAETLGEAGAGHVFTLGFCLGGRAAFLQASQEGIAGAVGFYGWPARAEDGGRSPIDEAREGLVRAPVLALYGGADRGITPDQVEAYDRALTEAAVTHETVVYPGAAHSFFDRRMAEHAEACADAWRRVLSFMGVPAD